MTTCNPVLKPTKLDKLSDAYWSSVTARVVLEGMFMLAGVASVVAIVVALA